MVNFRMGFSITVHARAPHIVIRPRYSCEVYYYSDRSTWSQGTSFLFAKPYSNAWQWKCHDLSRYLTLTASFILRSQSLRTDEQFIPPHLSCQLLLQQLKKLPMPLYCYLKSKPNTCYKFQTRLFKITRVATEQHWRRRLSNTVLQSWYRMV